MALTAEQRAQLYYKWFYQEGYNPKEPEADEDKDFSIILKKEGLSIVVYFHANDPAFVRFILPNFFSLETEDEKINMYLAAEHVGRRCKLAKIQGNTAEDPDDCWALVEFLHGNDELNPDLAERYIGMLLGGANEFRSKMSQLKVG